MTAQRRDRARESVDARPLAPRRRRDLCGGSRGERPPCRSGALSCDRLFAQHPDTPIGPGNRRSWRGASWYPYDPKWRTVGIVEPALSIATFDIPLAADGVIHCTRVARVSFTIASETATLALYWFGGYGGGLWLPFSDATSGESTYGGGRYLYDTIKGADLGADADRIVLDFNFAYNPSCAYDDRWVCPLSPAENALPFAVTAGEQTPEG